VAETVSSAFRIIINTPAIPFVTQSLKRFYSFCGGVNGYTFHDLMAQILGSYGLYSIVGGVLLTIFRGTNCAKCKDVRRTSQKSYIPFKEE
jgi:hypothetical protein